MAAATANMSRVPATRRLVCGAELQVVGLTPIGLPLLSQGKGEKTMKQLRIGDITIDAVIERDGPWRRPQDFFPAYDEAVFQHHLRTMEPEVFDSALGLMVITYQTVVVRTPLYTILVDTCTGENKGHP